MGLKLYVLYCVLVQVLFIPVHADVQVHCPNQTGILGGKLNVTCSVTCSEKDGCKIQNEMYFQDQKNNQYKFICDRLKCYHTIKSTDKNHSGTYSVWVQTNRGENQTTFTVNLGSLAKQALGIENESFTTNLVKPTTVYTVKPTIVHPDVRQEKVAANNGSSKAAMAIVLLILSLALPTIALVALKKSKRGSKLFEYLRKYITSSEPTIV